LLISFGSPVCHSRHAVFESSDEGQEQSLANTRAKPNLNNLSVDALLSLRKDVDRELETKRRQLERQISALGGGAGKNRRSLKGRKVAPKYRDSAGNTWAGRGARPRWLVAALKKGQEARELRHKMSWVNRLNFARRPPRGTVLDMDSSVSPTHGEQEMSARRLRVPGGRAGGCPFRSRKRPNSTGVNRITRS